MHERFGQKLEAYRTLIGKSQYRVAIEIDVHHSHLSRLEGNLRFITADKAEKLADYLVVPCEERATFYLLAAGHDPNLVFYILNPAFLHLSYDNETGTHLYPNEIIANQISKFGWSQADLARVMSDIRNRKTHPSSISKIISGANRIDTAFGEELAIGADIPRGYRAEFFLLTRGHSYTEVFESLTAIGGTVKPLDPALP